jgi:cytosine permease
VAVLGFDVMRWLLRVVLPLSLGSAAVLIGLYLASDDPAFAVGRVFASPDQQLTWVGFATFVTVMCGASLTLVTNVADFSRYAPTRRDVRVGLFASAVLSVVVTAFVGGYVGAATGETNPFVAAAALTTSDVLLVLLLVAIVVQTFSANLTNVYTAGMSLVNAVPRLGRLPATIAAGLMAVVLSGFPAFIEEAQAWITHLGNVAAPLAGVVLADYVLVQRTRIDVPALFDPRGRYRYAWGVNLAAVAATALGVGIFYAVPHELVKVVWGVSAAALAYLALSALQARLLERETTVPQLAAEQQ